MAISQEQDAIATVAATSITMTEEERQAVGARAGIWPGEEFLTSDLKLAARLHEQGKLTWVGGAHLSYPPLQAPVPATATTDDEAAQRTATPSTEISAEIESIRAELRAAEGPVLKASEALRTLEAAEAEIVDRLELKKARIQIESLRVDLEVAKRIHAKHAKVVAAKRSRLATLEAELPIGLHRETLEALAESYRVKLPEFIVALVAADTRQRELAEIAETIEATKLKFDGRWQGAPWAAGGFVDMAGLASVFSDALRDHGIVLTFRDGRWTVGATEASMNSPAVPAES